MNDLAKSVFISFRTEYSEWQGDSIYNFLVSKGYSVFYSPTSLGSGEFAPKIIDAINKAGHFVLILAPNTLEKCSESGDWVRQEIETAIDHLPHMNIIPILVDGFDTKSPKVKSNFVAAGRKVQKIQGFQTVTAVPGHMKQACMELHGYLETHSIDFSSRNVPDADEQETIEKISLAQSYYKEAGTHGEKGDFNTAIKFYSKAIILDKMNADCFTMRGLMYYRLNMHDKARADYLKAIQLDRHDPFPYNNIGVISADEGDLYAALHDFEVAITLNPRFARPYFHKAKILWKIGELNEALRCFDAYAELDGSRRNNNEVEFNQLYQELKAVIAKQPPEHGDNDIPY